MTTKLTVEKARAIVEHAEDELTLGNFTPDVFAAFARGGASTRAEASNAFDIVIADYLREVLSAGGKPQEMDEFVAYTKSCESIAMRLAMVAVTKNDGQKTLATAVNSETVRSFLNYLLSLAPTEPDYFPKVYRRIGLTFPAEPETERASQELAPVKKPWWRIW